MNVRALPLTCGQLVLLAALAWPAGPLHAQGAAKPVSSDAQASRLYEDALTRFEKKDHAGAIIQLKNALKIDRKVLQVHLLLGRALMASGQVPAAEAALLEALRLGVSRSEIVVLLAQAMITQGKQQELFQQPAFNQAGLPPTVASKLATVKAGAQADLGDSKQALRLLDDARSLDPTSPDPWLTEVAIRIRSRQLGEAQLAVERARSLDPNNPEVFHQQGSIHHVTGNREAALAAYGRALELKPDHVDVLVARAGLYLDLKRDADASRDVTKLLALAETEPRGWYLSSMLLEREGKTDAARKAIGKITELLDPVPIEFIRFRPQLLMLAGQAHYSLGNREKAKPYFEVFQRLQPVSPVSKLLANILLAEGNYDRAIDSLEQYLRGYPGDSQAMALLASAHMAQGRHTRAASLMQDALRRKDDPELYTAYGLSLMGTGQSKNALAQLETAYRKDPNQRQAAFALVGLYLRGGQVAKAVPVAQALVTAAPSNPSFHNLQGMVKQAQGDRAGARASFERAGKLDPSFVQAPLNLARLDIAEGQFDRAQAQLDAVLKGDDRNLEAILEQGTLAMRRGNEEAAIRWLGKGHDLYALSDARSGLMLVDLHLRRGRKEPAHEIARQLNANIPDNLPILVALARTQVAMGDTAAARTSLGTATRLAQFNAPMQVEIALLQLSTGNLTGAGYSLEKALNDKPDFVPAHAVMAEIEIKQGELAKAEQRAQGIVKREPRLPVGYSILGDVAMARRQVPAAIDWYRKAHQAQPSLQTLERLASTLGASDVKAATRLLEDWVKTRSSDRVARNMLAERYVRNGDFAGARREYEALRAQQPNEVSVLNNLANVLLRLNDLPAAQAAADAALALAPQNAVIIDTAGWVALKNNQVDRAVQLLRDARLRDPENPEIRFHLASALVKAGRTAEGKAEVQAAVRSRHAFEGRGDAEALLRSLGQGG